jgi:arylsulfatase A-like enzyme
MRPAPDDIRRLGPVIDRYLEYLDRRLARLLGRFAERPNVLVVADHGQEGSPQQPMWKGWHSKWGVFIAAGPDVTPHPEPRRLSYVDVVPTLLALLGFDVPGDLAGNVVPLSAASSSTPGRR